ncbi:SDR family oxidoreductase [Crocinitomix algicola]|uniref:SDR family oxidoreductase n=1 Tax=Crocinitomix algicola TaxID=1740263 RepID=UPI00083301E8|nr:SDR family oxidoreductase [Crocinitomix algicola]
MILITGATGHYGMEAIKSLIHKGANPTQIIGLVRNQNKSEELRDLGIVIREGNYDNIQTLKDAFIGVEKLLFVSGSEVETRESQHKNIVDAAKSSGVEHIIYTSFIRNTPASTSAISFLQNTHEKTEKWIMESGITYTILQNSLYLDMLPIFIGENLKESGVIIQPAANGKVSAVLRSELAEAAAEIIHSKGHENKVYSLTNNQAVSYQDIAEAISQANDQEIRYISTSPDEYRSEMEKHNVPTDYINLISSFSQAQAKGELEVIDGTLEKLLKRQPTPTTEYLSQVYA